MRSCIVWKFASWVKKYLLNIGCLEIGSEKVVIISILIRIFLKCNRLRFYNTGYVFVDCYKFDITHLYFSQWGPKLLLTILKISKTMTTKQLNNCCTLILIINLHLETTASFLYCAGYFQTNIKMGSQRIPIDLFRIT